MLQITFQFLFQWIICAYSFRGIYIWFCLLQAKPSLFVEHVHICTEFMHWHFIQYYGVLIYCISYATCRNMPQCIVKCNWVQLKVEIIKMFTASVTLCILAIIFCLFLSYWHMHDKNKIPVYTKICDYNRFKCVTRCLCPRPGSEPADQPRAAAADAKRKRTGAPSAAGVSEPAGPHAHLLPHWSHRRLPASTGGTGTAYMNITHFCVGKTHLMRSDTQRSLWA